MRVQVERGERRSRPPAGGNSACYACIHVYRLYYLSVNI